jgi:two-component system nitrate/nitrite response regulator NarL
MIPEARASGRGAHRRVRVLIADDHPLYRKGVLKVFERRAEFEVVGEAADGDQALEAIRRTSPDVVILDLRLPKLTGVEVIEALERERLETKVVIVSAYEDSSMIYRAIAAGARAYLLKLVQGNALADAVLAVDRGETLIPAELQAGLASELRSRHKHPDGPMLSARELEVLRLAAEGRSTREIADELFLGVTTVKTHLSHIYDKLEVSDRTAAVAKGLRQGWLK